MEQGAEALAVSGVGHAADDSDPAGSPCIAVLGDRAGPGTLEPRRGQPRAGDTADRGSVGRPHHSVALGITLAWG